MRGLTAKLCAATIGVLAMAPAASANVETFRFHAARWAITQTCSPAFVGGQLFPLTVTAGGRDLVEFADQSYAFFTDSGTFVRAETVGRQVCFLASTSHPSIRVTVRLQEVSFGVPEQRTP